MSRPPIRAAFFDIGNVLLHFSLREVVKTVAWELRRHPVKVARYLWASRIGERVERGELEGEELYRLFREDLGFKGSYARFVRVWCDHFTLDRGADALLTEVSRKVPTYLLSNTNALHIDFIRSRYAFPRRVKGAVLSHEVRLRKPDPAIYRKALKLSGTRPQETVFVDDLKKNVASAERLGLHAIRYRGAEDLRRRLDLLGLL